MAASIKPNKPVTAYGINGMNNLPEAPAYFLDKERRTTPHLIVNADVTDGGVVRPRGGFAAEISISGPHSLAGEEKGLSVFLVVVDEVLYRVEGTTMTALASVGPRAQMNYAEVNNRIFCSSIYWNGIYNLLTGEVEAWGQDPPVAPDIDLVAGDLPPGRYSLAYTRAASDGRQSGNGPLTQIAWEGLSRGIQLNNLEDDLTPWITHPDGGKLFLALWDSYDQITAQAPTIRPLLTQSVIPPPLFAHFCQAHGRMWGVSGRNLYFSEPGEYEWFKRGNYLPFMEDLVMVAPVNEGMFVNSLTSTWFLAGTSPKKMKVDRIADGAVPGTLIIAQVPGSMTALDGLLRPKGPQMPLPIWMARTGFVTGSHGGTVTHMTNSALTISMRQRGAGLFRYLSGIPQVVMTQSGLPNEVDEEMTSIISLGALV